MTSKIIDKKLMGKRSRAAGKRFESLVRKDLIEKGWIVSRFDNDVDYPDSNINKEPDKREGMQLKQAKMKWTFGPMGRFPLNTSPGFPDFIAYIIPNSMTVKIGDSNFNFDGVSSGKNNMYLVYGIESKINGKLDKKEKEKCKWLLDNKIFSKILIASKHKVKNKIVIKYEEFK